jgi:hypothetical protein
MAESEEDFVIDALRASELVQLGGPLPDRRPDATRAEHSGQPLPYIDMSAPGGDGEELTDYDIVGSNDERTGLFSLDDLPRIDFINVPLLASGVDLGVTTFLAAERYCARRHATLIWDPPWSWTSAASALVELRGRGITSPDAMSYFPRIRQAVSPERHPLGLPAGGAIAGLLAAHDRGEYWRSLDERPVYLKGGLVPQLPVEEREARVLKRHGINVLTVSQGHGAMLTGNVSMLGTSAVSRLWQRLDRRRLLAQVLKTLEQHTRWALRAKWSRGFERELVGQIHAYLRELFEVGALAGARADQAYFVRLRAGIAGEHGEIALRVGVALERAAEFQVYDLIHRAGGSVARPAPPCELAELAS